MSTPRTRTGKLVVTETIHFARSTRGRHKAVAGGRPEPQPDAGRVPRISRLMALAIRFDQLIRDGHVRDYADLARLGHVTRARITQIMNLNLLAPDIQEQILHLPTTVGGRDPIPERQVRAIAAEPDWRKQRKLWRRLTPRCRSACYS